MIFEQELTKERQQKWHVADGALPLRTLDDAREFLNSVGFCLAYPVRAMAAPTFIGAYAGTEEDLPSAKQAFADENARSATELIVRMLKEKSAFEVAFGEDASLLVSEAEFPYFYALVGDRNPKAAPSPGPRGEQALTTHTFEIIDQHGPISEDEMRRKLGREISRNAIEKVLHGLWSKLRIVRVDEGLESGEPVEPVWDLMHRFAPQQVNRGKQISMQEALSALISKYLETVISAEQKDVEEFFSRLVPRSRVTEVCKAMLSAQEFAFVQVSGKTMLRLSPRGGEEAVPVPAGEHKVRPWQAREQGNKAAEEKRAKYAERAERTERATGPGGAFHKFSKDRKPFAERKPFGERKEPGARKEFEDRGPRKFGERKSFGERKDFKDRGPKRFGDRKPFGEGKSFAGKKPFGGRPGFSKERPPRAEGAPAQERGGFKKPFGERKSFSDRPKPFGPRKSLSESGKSFADRKSFGGKNRPSHNRERFAGRSERGSSARPAEGEQRGGFKGGFKKDHPPRRDSFSPRGEKRPGGFKKDYPPRKDSSSPRGDGGGKSFGGRKPFGAKKSGGPKSFGERKPLGVKKFGGPKSFGAKKPFGKPFGKRKPPAGDRPPSKRREEPSE